MNNRYLRGYLQGYMNKEAGFDQIAGGTTGALIGGASGVIATPVLMTLLLKLKNAIGGRRGYYGGPAPLTGSDMDLIGNSAIPGALLGAGLGGYMGSRVGKVTEKELAEDDKKGKEDKKQVKKEASVQQLAGGATGALAGGIVGGVGLPLLALASMALTNKIGLTKGNRSLSGNPLETITPGQGNLAYQLILPGILGGAGLGAYSGYTGAAPKEEPKKA